MSNLTNGISRYSPNGNSNIPLRKSSLNRTNSNSSTHSNPPLSPSKIPVNNPEVQKWKLKYDDAEQKRKAILVEKEKRKFLSMLQQKKNIIFIYNLCDIFMESGILSSFLVRKLL